VRQRYALDASVLASIVNSDDSEHFACYYFFRNLHDYDAATWVVPGLIFFEFQATQSRRYKERRPESAVFRHAPLFMTNTELYHVTDTFLARVWDLSLYDQFSSLRGADLLYACIAFVESIPLVTHDADFDRYSHKIRLIKPREAHGP
jgi:predicted nucleic acid-binding protein